MTAPAVVDGERRPPPAERRGRRSSFVLVPLFAMLFLVAADRVAWWLAPPRPLREVEDAVADLRAGDPTLLVIGSSHGRTFAVLGDSLRERTHDRQRAVAVPVEWGKLTSYRWVLEERLLPILDEQDAGGARKRTSLERAILVTEWWDSCRDASPPRNLPARSWTWRHYAEDLLAHGPTAYNENFLASRWRRVWHRSALVQDRGQGRLLSAVRQRIAPSTAEERKVNFDRLAGEWQRMVEAGNACIGAPEEMGALAAMADTLRARGAEVTILLYPRMPSTLTQLARETTLAAFTELVHALAAPRGIRVIDLTTDAPLSDADFGEDFDHLVPAANARFSGWALDGPLAFLEGARE